MEHTDGMWTKTEGEGEDPEAVFMAAVRELRELRGWTQQQLADRLREMGVNMNRGTVGKIEAGVRAVRWRDVLALAAALGTDPAFLGTGGHSQPNIAVTPETVMSPSLMRQWIRGNVYLKLDSEDRAPDLALADDEWIGRQRRYLADVYQHVQELLDADADGDQKAKDAAWDALVIDLERHQRFEQRHGGVTFAGREYRNSRR